MSAYVYPLLFETYLEAGGSKGYIIKHLYLWCVFTYPFKRVNRKCLFTICVRLILLGDIAYVFIHASAMSLFSKKKWRWIWSSPLHQQSVFFKYNPSFLFLFSILPVGISCLLRPNINNRTCDQSRPNINNQTCDQSRPNIKSHVNFNELNLWAVLTCCPSWPVLLSVRVFVWGCG